MSALTVQGRYGVEHIQVDPCAKVLAQPTEDDDLDVLLQLAHDLGELAPHVKVLRAQARRTDREGGHVVSDWKSGEGGGGQIGAGWARRRGASDAPPRCRAWAC